MNLLLWGITLGTVGKLILGIAVLRVHIRMFEEHSIDNIVLQAIKKEHYLTIFALLLIVLGYFFEVYFYNSSTQLLNCSGAECAAAVSAAFSR